MQVFRRSKLWVVDVQFDGRPRRWFKALPPDVDAVTEMTRSTARQAADGLVQ